MTRVLVTGGNGFIGRHAARALVHMGHDVIVASRTPPTTVGVSSVAIDLLEVGAGHKLIAQAKPDVLLHLAWETETGAFWTAESNTQWLASSHDLLNAFLDNGGSRAVFAGSCAEYDWAALGPDGTAYEEKTPCIPATKYGQAKAAFFNDVQRHIAQGASCAWGRLFLLYGEYEHPERFISSIIRNLLLGREAPMSSGLQVRDFMDTRDAGRAFAVLATDSTTGALNIASGTGVTLKSVAKMIGEKIERPELICIGALGDRPGDPPALVADVTRLASGLGFDPAYNLNEGLDHAIDFWRHTLANGALQPE